MTEKTLSDYQKIIKAGYPLDLMEIRRMNRLWQLALEKRNKIQVLADKLRKEEREKHLTDEIEKILKYFREYIINDTFNCGVLNQKPLKYWAELIVRKIEGINEKP